MGLWPKYLAHFELNLKHYVLSFFLLSSFLLSENQIWAVQKATWCDIPIFTLLHQPKISPILYYVWLRCTIGDIKEEGGPKLRYFCWFYFFTGSRKQSPTWFSLTPILIYLFNLLLLSIWCHFSHKLTNKSVTAQNIWPKLTFHK